MDVKAQMLVEGEEPREIRVTAKVAEPPKREGFDAREFLARAKNAQDQKRQTRYYAIRSGEYFEPKD
jgi:hypothetical protein